MILHGDKLRAYRAAYPRVQDPKTALSAANRLLARPDVAAQINDTHIRLKAEVEAELKEQMTSALLSELRIKEILTQMAEGLLMVEKNYRRKDGHYDTLMLPPSHSQRLRAITIFLRMCGLYDARNRSATGAPGQAEKQQAQANNNRRAKDTPKEPVEFRIFIDGKPFPKGPGYDPVTGEKLPPSTPVIARSNAQAESLAATKQSSHALDIPTPTPVIASDSEATSRNTSASREVASSQAGTQAHTLAPRNFSHELANNDESKKDNVRHWAADGHGFARTTTNNNKTQQLQPTPSPTPVPHLPVIASDSAATSRNTPALREVASSQAGTQTHPLAPRNDERKKGDSNPRAA